MKTLLLVLLSAASGAALGALAEYNSHPHPTLTPLLNGGWTYQHVPMPPCPDALKRTVDIPEQDEVDALTIDCR